MPRLASDSPSELMRIAGFNKTFDFGTFLAKVP
jgi:hypothetical protein